MPHGAGKGFQALNSTTEQGGAIATWSVAKTSASLQPTSKRRWRKREQPLGGVSRVAIVSLIALIACFLVGTSVAAKTWVEGEVRAAVREALDKEGFHAVEVDVDGQHVVLRGIRGPDAERARDTALEAAGPTWTGRRIAAVAVDLAPEGQVLDGSEARHALVPAPSRDVPEETSPSTASEPSETQEAPGTSAALTASRDLSPAGAPKEGAAASSTAQPDPSETAAKSIALMAVSCETKLASLLKERPVRFAVNSSRLTQEAELVLDSLAETLEGCRETNIRIEGHTDASGSAPANQVLSEGRARAVLDGLVARGVHRSRMTSAGFGPSRPLVPEETLGARALNRRIEIRIEAGASSGGKD